MSIILPKNFWYRDLFDFAFSLYGGNAEFVLMVINVITSKGDQSIK